MLFKSFRSLNGLTTLRISKFALLMLGIASASALYSQQTFSDSNSTKIKVRITAELGYSINLSKVKLQQAINAANYFKANQKPFLGISYSLGFEVDRSHFLLGFKFKSVRIGDRFEFESETDTLKDRYIIFASNYKTNYMVNCYLGKTFAIKKIRITPNIGFDYLLNPNYNIIAGALFENAQESIVLRKEVKTLKDYILLLYSNICVEVPFKIKRQLFTVGYVFSFSGGFTEMYRTDISVYNTNVYNTTKEYVFTNSNKGSHFSQAIKLSFVLF